MPSSQSNARDLQSVQGYYAAREASCAARAAQEMQGFSYVNIASDDRGVGDITEVWRCQRPGSGIWAFDMVASRRGLAVFGDIDGLIFRPGMTIRLLATASMDYLVGKLEAQCREPGFDPVGFCSLCVGAVSDRLADEADAAGWGDVLDAFDAAVIADARLGVTQGRIAGVAALDAGLRALERRSGQATVEANAGRLSSMRDFLCAAKNVAHEGLPRAYEFLAEYRDIVGQDIEPGSITIAPESLVIRMESVRTAAREIVRLVQTDIDDDVQTSDADGSRGRMRGG